ncbi:MAG: hypothetical protein ACOYK6_07815 [Chthoniobacterales bacterium]
MNLKSLKFKKTLKLCFLGVSISCLATGMLSCVTNSPQMPEVIVAPHNEENKILDIKFAKVYLPQMKMWNALLVLTDAINEFPEKISRFSWGVHVTPNSSKDLTNKENPLVSINQANVTLRQVLDELCKKSGWTYKESFIGISFEVQRK